MEVKYITTQQDLNACVEQLSGLPEIALDLEFDKNRFRYGFTMCLIQVAGKDAIFVIDPLEKLDLSAFFALLENRQQRLVVFEFGEDLRLLHAYGCKPTNIYDISFASKLLNNAQISLATLADKILGIELSKGAQKSNWTLRPLTSEQIKYAADDVRYLFEIEAKLKQEIAEAEIDHWVDQENRAFEEMEVEEDEEDLLFLKHKDKKDCSQMQWHIFSSLMKFRDEKAQQYNRPAFQILDKDFLLELSKDEKRIKDFFKSARPYKALNNETFKAQLIKKRLAFSLEAKEMGLSNTKSAIEKLSPAELSEIRRRKHEEEELKEKVLKPIQSVIKERLGEQTASFILSNKLMAEIARGNWDKFCSYRVELIREIASDLKLQLP